MVMHAEQFGQCPELVHALQCYPLQAGYAPRWEQMVWCLRGGSCRQAGPAQALQRQAQGTVEPRKEERLMTTAEWCPARVQGALCQGRGQRVLGPDVAMPRAVEDHGDAKKGQGASVPGSGC